MVENKKLWYKRWWAIVFFIFIGLIIIGSFLPDSSNSKSNSNVVFESNTSSQSNDCKQDSENVLCKPAMDIIGVSAMQENNFLGVLIKLNGVMPKKEALKMGTLSSENYQYRIVINPGSSSNGLINYEQFWVATLEANKDWEIGCFYRPSNPCSKDISFKIIGDEIFMSGEVKTKVVSIEIESAYGESYDNVYNGSPEITDKVILE